MVPFYDVWIAGLVQIQMTIGFVVMHIREGNSIRSGLQDRFWGLPFLNQADFSSAAVLIGAANFISRPGCTKKNRWGFTDGGVTDALAKEIEYGGREVAGPRRGKGILAFEFQGGGILRVGGWEEPCCGCLSGHC